jgi:hypothetical protein
MMFSRNPEWIAIPPTILGNVAPWQSGSSHPPMIMSLPLLITGSSGLSATNYTTSTLSTSSTFQTLTSGPNTVFSVTIPDAYPVSLPYPGGQWNVAQLRNLVYVNQPEPITTFVISQQTYAERNLSWKDKIRNEIAAYSNRPAGWDGYAAKPINPNAMADARKFVQMLPEDINAPRDIPCSDGEVSLVWRSDGRYAEISFPGNGTFYWYATNGTQEVSDDDVPVDRGVPTPLQEVMGFGIVTTSIPPIPQYGRVLLEAA